MYLPRQFEQTDTSRLYDLIRAQPFATLVTTLNGEITANHLPLHLDATSTPHATLRGHVARANPVWKTPNAHGSVLAIFHGPDAYITPNWYPTKREHGKAVPTWNYAVVHAYGGLTIHEDKDWLRAHLTELTTQHESGRDTPWALDDAPADYLDKMLGAVVGVEIEIERLEAKWKMSQNQPESNREGVVAGLEQEGTEPANQVAELIMG